MSEPLTLKGEEKVRMLYLVNNDAPVTMMLGYLISAFENSNDEVERDIGTAMESIVKQVFARHAKDVN